MAKPFKLKNGSLLVSTEAPGGIYNSSQLKAIAELSDNFSVISKVTEDQRIALFVKEESYDEIVEILKDVGLGIRHYKDSLQQPISCIGELCPFHQQDALGAAMTITEELSSISIDNNIRIGINGCSQCCVPTHTLDISLIGDDNGYSLHLGGKNSQIPELASFIAEDIPHEEIPKYIKNILDIYKQEAKEEESIQDVIERTGSTKFISALEPYSQDAMDSEHEFSLPSASDQTSEALESDIDNLEEESELDLPSDHAIESNASYNNDIDNPSDIIPVDENSEENSLGDNDIDPSSFNDTSELNNDISLDDDHSIDNHDDDVQIDNEIDIHENNMENDDLEDGNTAVDDIEIQDENNISETETIEDDDLEVQDENSIDETNINADDEEKELLIETEEPLDDIMENDESHSEIENNDDNDIILDQDDEDLSIEEEKDFEEEYEQKISEDIIQTSEVPTEIDTNSEIRNAAMDLIESEDTFEQKNENDINTNEENPMETPLGKTGGNWHLEGINLSDSNQVVLNFSEGAVIHLDPYEMGTDRRVLKIGKSKITVKPDGAMFSVEIDGMKLTIPSKKS